jgi:plasmid stabilization system protein ParE
MKFQYSFLDVAQEEYDTSVGWYADRSVVAANGFIEAVEETLELIYNNPAGWRNEYEDYFEIVMKKYPYTLVYSINMRPN